MRLLDSHVHTMLITQSFQQSYQTISYEVIKATSIINTYAIVLLTLCEYTILQHYPTLHYYKTLDFITLPNKKSHITTFFGVTGWVHQNFGLQLGGLRRREPLGCVSLLSLAVVRPLVSMARCTTTTICRPPGGPTEASENVKIGKFRNKYRQIVFVPAIVSNPD